MDKSKKKEIVLLIISIISILLFVILFVRAIVLKDKEVISGLILSLIETIACIWQYTKEKINN